MQGISSHAVKLPYKRTVGDNVFQLFSPDLQVPVGKKSVEFGFVCVCFVCLLFCFILRTWQGGGYSQGKNNNVWESMNWKYKVDIIGFLMWSETINIRLGEEVGELGLSLDV